MKKFTLLVLMIFALSLFSGCFGDEEETPTEVKTETSFYQTDEYSIYYPAEWEVIEKNDFTADIPKETQVVFRNNVKSDIFTANVNVSKTDISDRLTSKEYANEIINSQNKNLKNFKELAKEEVTLKIGESDINTFVYAFQGKQRTIDETVKFIQTYLAKGNSGYIATCAVSLSEDEHTSTICENMVRSLNVK